MSIDIPLIEIIDSTCIQINKEKYGLNNFDSFQSENRRRINALNIFLKK